MNDNPPNVTQYNLQTCSIPEPVDIQAFFPYCVIFPSIPRTVELIHIGVAVLNESSHSHRISLFSPKNPLKSDTQTSYRLSYRIPYQIVRTSRENYSAVLTLVSFVAVVEAKLPQLLPHQSLSALLGTVFGQVSRRDIA